MVIAKKELTMMTALGLKEQFNQAFSPSQKLSWVFMFAEHLPLARGLL